METAKNTVREDKVTLISQGKDPVYVSLRHPDGHMRVYSLKEIDQAEMASLIANAE